MESEPGVDVDEDVDEDGERPEAMQQVRAGRDGGWVNCNGNQFIRIWSKPILPKPDGVIASQQAAWGSGFKQATACEPGRCDSGFETDWRPCASGPDKEGVRLARAMVRSSPCHGCPQAPSPSPTRRARPGADSDSEQRTAARLTNALSQPTCRAHIAVRESRHGLCLCAPPGWAVTAPVTVISQYSMPHFRSSIHPGNYKVPALSIRPRALPPIAPAQQPIEPASAAAFAIVPSTRPPVCADKARRACGSLQWHIPTLSRLPVDALGHTGVRHHTRLPFCLRLGQLLSCPSTVHAASRSDRHGGLCRHDHGCKANSHQLPVLAPWLTTAMASMAKGEGGPAGRPSAAAADKAAAHGIPF
ncbi:hypothetical protein COCC4DRAFT_84528 [Bipolaris maydis ATCC 48331]|uniref:Uncharacterized protein n=2 Tax=Cochliobolus heterostrophus TaxID=5016 RepID=M2TL93_COCH5|nr:uncharacterized protein COCC4DRAFT_84528 [Bipolaris maydis ATCC 48331]EMD87259.1 hypothetical protein COCHEDRAFT_1206543 [Bipolaris maydis C5]KAJ6211876.1 hypothetical protein PSV09DRAFT_1206543 [Bipolaris maydis]ENI00346.1 hypothetical protein COCC4DRAFT_84528 [Bipolaris maydis ATCC 48331]KAJ6267195.1 hypothetical protein PSV08DRAFT_229908 [Bipolaris maydis]KAJ6277817.1 hypothetical protein J3E71DRAFT_394509 [Bipolaris maydis]